MKSLIIYIPPTITSLIYGFYVVPYGWDKWMNSQNYAAGDFGKFLCFSPILVFCVVLMAIMFCLEVLKRRELK